MATTGDSEQLSPHHKLYTGGTASRRRAFVSLLQRCDSYQEIRSAWIIAYNLALEQHFLVDALELAEKYDAPNRIRDVIASRHTGPTDSSERILVSLRSTRHRWRANFWSLLHDKGVYFPVRPSVHFSSLVATLSKKYSLQQVFGALVLPLQTEAYSGPKNGDSTIPYEGQRWVQVSDLLAAQVALSEATATSRASERSERQVLPPLDEQVEDEASQEEETSEEEEASQDEETDEEEETSEEEETGEEGETSSAEQNKTSLGEKDRTSAAETMEEEQATPEEREASVDREQTAPADERVSRMGSNGSPDTPFTLVDGDVPSDVPGPRVRQRHRQTFDQDGIEVISDAQQAAAAQRKVVSRVKTIHARKPRQHSPKVNVVDHKKASKRATPLSKQSLRHSKPAAHPLMAAAGPHHSPEGLEEDVLPGLDLPVSPVRSICEGVKKPLPAVADEVTPLPLRREQTTAHSAQDIAPQAFFAPAPYIDPYPEHHDIRERLTPAHMCSAPPPIGEPTAARIASGVTRTDNPDAIAGPIEAGVALPGLATNDYQRARRILQAEEDAFDARPEVQDIRAKLVLLIERNSAMRAVPETDPQRKTGRGGYHATMSMMQCEQQNLQADLESIEQVTRELGRHNSLVSAMFTPERFRIERIRQDEALIRSWRGHWTVLGAKVAEAEKACNKVERLST